MMHARPFRELSPSKVSLLKQKYERGRQAAMCAHRLIYVSFGRVAHPQEHTKSITFTPAPKRINQPKPAPHAMPRIPVQSKTYPGHHQIFTTDHSQLPDPYQ